MVKGGGRRRARSEMGIGCRGKRVKERERKRELSFVRVPFSQSQRQSEKKTVLRLYFLLLQIWATKQTTAGTGPSWISTMVFLIALPFFLFYTSIVIDKFHFTQRMHMEPSVSLFGDFLHGCGLYS